MIKRIVINGKFLAFKVTGMERFAREIVSELDKIIDNNIEVILLIPSNAINIPNFNKIKVKQTIGKGTLWEQIILPYYVRKYQACLVNLCNYAPFINPYYVCLHDFQLAVNSALTSLLFRLWHKLLYFNVVHRSKKIFTVSQFSKDEIVRHYGVSGTKISIIYNSWEHYTKINYDDNVLCKNNLVEQEYFFAMSSISPHKNFKWIAKVARNCPQYKFIVAGSIGKRKFSEEYNFECPDNMKLIGYVTDEEAKTLLKNAKAFLFPSLYEGFGIPPIEAIVAGCKKIVVSDIPVMHEVLEDAVIYIDPFKYELPDVDIIEISEERLQYVLSKYSWRKSAELLLDEIMSLSN